MMPVFGKDSHDNMIAIRDVKSILEWLFQKESVFVTFVILC